MAQLGADVEQLEQLSRRMDAAGQRFDASAKHMTASLNAVAWHGPDADSFRSWWKRNGATRLTSASEWLRELGTSLRKQAAEQRRTSTEGRGRRQAARGPAAPTARRRRVGRSRHRQRRRAVRGLPTRHLRSVRPGRQG